MTAAPFEPGEVLLASYPFTDHSTAKLRPVVVVSEARFNHGGDFVALPISSQIESTGQFGYVIRDSEPYFARSGLRRSSTVKWTKPMTLNHVVIQRRLGRLPGDVVREITGHLGGVLGIGEHG
jgi:mRNA-degrading endonuclease toxin of MazEF toxin-antitoxin module